MVRGCCQVLAPLQGNPGGWGAQLGSPTAGGEGLSAPLAVGAAVLVVVSAAGLVQQALCSHHCKHKCIVPHQGMLRQAGALPCYGIRASHPEWWARASHGGCLHFDGRAPRHRPTQPAKLLRHHSAAQQGDSCAVG